MRQHYEYLDAVNPVDGNKFTVKISCDRMQNVARRGKGHVYEMAYVLPEVLTKPKAIFAGLRKDEDEPRERGSFGRLCYVGSPSVAYRSNGQRVEPWPGQVYLVFVSDENVAYNWTWVKADSKDLNMPKEFDKRFKRRVL